MIETTANQKNHRRWLRFNLRTLLIMITLLCVWLAMQFNSARRQKEAVAAILKAGGSVAFDYQIASSSVESDFLVIDRDAAPRWPQWLRRVFGDDFFRTAIQVDFNDATTEAVLEQLANLPDLRQLYCPRLIEP